jgi:thiosulfate reductase cytochrome b subunit
MGWWPGWNTIEGADWWHEFFWWLGIACLAGLVVSEVVAKRYSTRKDELVAIDQQRHCGFGRSPLPLTLG